ncbi:MAG TPA: class I SAM-dependent methyltransferase, partial [Pirellulales bacterium]
MSSSEFTVYKTSFLSAIIKVLRESESGRLDEAAFPAYSHRNPLINWLFWSRLRKAMTYLDRGRPYERALDFGCGSGVMLPFLGRVASHVIALDVDLLPITRVKSQITFPSNVEVRSTSEFALDDLPAASCDIITALDVLEHVDNLPRTLKSLMRLLKPGGRLVVSGPTENILYQ